MLHGGGGDGRPGTFQAQAIEPFGGDVAQCVADAATHVQEGTRLPAVQDGVQHMGGQAGGHPDFIFAETAVPEKPHVGRPPYTRLPSQPTIGPRQDVVKTGVSLNRRLYSLLQSFHDVRCWSDMNEMCSTPAQRMSKAVGWTVSAASVSNLNLFCFH